VIPRDINMDSSENSIIRIPFTFGQKFWLGLLALLAAGFSIAAWITWDALFLLGILALIVLMQWIGRWIGQSPGKIEFASEHSYLVRSRRDCFPWLHDGDNWERNILPTRVHFQLVDTGFRWLDGRLEILTSKGSIFLGSGEKMLPIRDWLVRHGMQPK